MIKLLKKYEEVIKYLITGVLTTIISLATYYFCVHTFLDPNNGIELQIANIISWIVSVTMAYLANRSFVFKSDNKVIKELISFYASRLFTLIVDMGLMFIFVTLLSFSDTIMKLIVQVVVIVLNYILSKIFVFKKTTK